MLRVGRPGSDSKPGACFRVTLLQLLDMSDLSTVKWVRRAIVNKVGEGRDNQRNSNDVFSPFRVYISTLFIEFKKMNVFDINRFDFEPNVSINIIPRQTNRCKEIKYVIYD